MSSQGTLHRANSGLDRLNPDHPGKVAGANIEAAAWKETLQQSADSGDVVQTDPSRKSLIAKIPESEMGSRYQARPASMLAAEGVHPPRRIPTSARALSVANTHFRGVAQR